MKAVISMMILHFRLVLVVEYLGLKLSKSPSKLDLTNKTRETKKVSSQFQVSVFTYINSIDIGPYNLY